MPFYTTRESLAQPFLLNWVTGRYYPPPFQGTLTTATGSSLSMYCNAHYVPNLGGVTLDKVGFELTTGVDGSTARIGLYRDFNGRPEELLLDAGTVATAIANQGWVEADINQFVPQGWFWVAVISTSGLGWRAFVSGTHINMYSHPDEGNLDNATLTYRIVAAEATTGVMWNAGLPELNPGFFSGSPPSTPAGPIHTTGIPRTMVLIA